MATCPACREDNKDGARFCSACGTALVPSSAPREERRLVSILFVDLVGHTARSDQADPEDVRDLLRRYHADVKVQIEQFGGVVEKFIGDAVMAVFGAPHAFGDDAERAVRAGLRAVDAVAAIKGGEDTVLQARAAVATGEAVVNVDENRAGTDALATGDVVNTAARLQSAAPVGGVVVDAATLQASRRGVRFEERDPVVAKGKAQPIAVWQAIAASASPGDRQAGGAPMRGRDHELDLLRSTWTRSTERQRPHLAVVMGVAGAGKSRLLRELGGWLVEQDAQVLRGRCLPYEQGDVYGAFAQQLKQLAGVEDSDTPTDAAAKVTRLVEAVAPEEERSDVLRSCSVLLEPDPEELVGLEPTLLRYGFRRLVEGVSALRPTLWVFEDIHWAQDAEFELIHYLAVHVRDVPAMLVAAARPELVEARPDWNAGLMTATTVELEPLGADDAASVVVALAGDRLGPDEVQRLVATAEGNPLFLEELVGAVLDGADASGPLPTSVRAAIASRIDVLPTAPRSVLLAASVIGRHFWVGPLQELCPDQDVHEVLELLEVKDFIRRQPTSSVRGEVEYLFRHALIRDVCHGTLPRAERAAGHGRVAAYLDSKVGDDRDLAWLLAHHWEAAGEPEHAVRHLLVAAERAAAALAITDALGLLDRADRLAPDEPTATSVRLARALTLTLFGMYDDALPALEALLPSLDGEALLAALIAYARSCHWTERTEEVIRAAQQAVDLASATGPLEYLGPALARLSQGFAMRGEDGDLTRAVDLGERALREWVPGTQTEERAEHEHLLADQYIWLGEYPRAYELAMAAEGTAVDPASAEARLRGGGMGGWLLASMGRYEEAIARADQMIALGREMGRGVRVLTNYSTLAYRELYDLAEARRRSEEALDGMPRTSFHMPWMNAEVDIAHADLLAGSFGAARTRCEAMWEPVLATPAWERWLLGGKLAAFRAEIALRTDDLDGALEWATRAVDVARTSRRTKYLAVARTTLGAALLKAGRGAEALPELIAGAAVADQVGNPFGRWTAHAELAQALYRTGDDAGAEQHHALATGIVQEVAAGLSPARAERFLAAVPLPGLSDYR